MLSQGYWLWIDHLHSEPLRELGRNQRGFRRLLQARALECYFQMRMLVSLKVLERRQTLVPAIQSLIFRHLDHAFFCCGPHSLSLTVLKGAMA